jgi:hypothetical protein
MSSGEMVTRAPSLSSANMAFKFAATSAVDTEPYMAVVFGFSGSLSATPALAASAAAAAAETAAPAGMEGEILLGGGGGG